MKDRTTPQLNLISPGEEPATILELLVPFATVNFARVLASCFLGGTATGFNRSDAQSRSNDWLVAFESCVPSWALEECEADGGVPVIVHLLKECIESTDHGGFFKILCPVATRSIKRISFQNEEQLSEATARLSRFPDVPWSLLDFDVQPNLFGNLPEKIEKIDTSKPQVDEVQEKLDRPRLERIGGVVASQLGLMTSSEAHDEAISNLYCSSIKAGTLGIAIYDTVVPVPNDASADKNTWNACWDYLSSRDISEGFRGGDLLDHVSAATKGLESRPRKKIEEWINFSEGIISASRELPLNWRDSENPAMRAILLFILTNSHQRLESFLFDHDAGPRVKLLAMSLVGEFETIKRFKKEEIAPNRQALDSLSDLIIGISKGEPQKLSVEDPQFSPDGNLESEIRSSGNTLAVRKQVISPIVQELFNVSDGLAMEHGYDTEKKLFYIEGSLEKKRKGNLRIFFSLESEAQAETQSRIKFFVPVLVASKTRSPQAKKLKALLETAWQQELAIGIYEEGDKNIVAFFCTHLVDKFIVPDFEDMIARFKRVLT